MKSFVLQRREEGKRENLPTDSLAIGKCIIQARTNQLFYKNIYVI